MTASVLLLWVMLGQTTRPATPPPPRRPVASQPATTRPAAARVRVSTQSAVPAPRSQTPANPAQPTTPRPGQPTTPPIAMTPRQSITLPTTTRPAERITVAPTGVTQATPTTMPAETDLNALIAALSGERVQVEVTADGKIILTGRPEDIAIWQKFIQAMETAPEAQPIFKVVQLQNAQAATLAPQVTQLWNQAHQPAIGAARPEDRLSIIPEPRANLLLVATASKNMQDVVDLINQLDVPSLQQQPILFRPIQLKHMKANEAETAVRELLKSLQDRKGATQTEPATIKADMRTNQLLISASQADFDQIQKLIDTLDVPPVAGISSVKFAIFKLKKANAEQLVKVLNDILTAQPATGAAGGAGSQSQAMREQIRRLQMIYMGPDGAKELPELDLEKQIRVFADPGTDSVIVATSENNIKPMQAIVEMLDSLPMSDDINVRIYPLQYADAEQLQTSLQGMFDKGPDLPVQPRRTTPNDRVPPNPEGQALAYRVSFAVDKRTNTLIVAGRPDQIQLVEQVLKNVDVKDPTTQFIPRLVKLEHADAKTLADMLQKLIDQRQKLVEAGGPNVAKRQTITLLPDPRSNSLVLVANDENFNEISDLAKKLDTAQVSLNAGAQFFNIKNADVVRVSDMLDQLLKGIQSTLPDQKQLQYAVVADPRTKTLLVSGTRDALQQAATLVEKLDVQAGSPTAETRVYTLQQASARQLQQVLTDVFEQKTTGGGGGGAAKQPARSPVLIQSVDASNSLLVTASAEEQATVQELLKSLDRPSNLAQQLRIFPLAHARADTVADTLTKLLKEQQSAGGGGAGKGTGAPPIAITPDTRSGSLLVYAPPDMMSNIAQIIQALDTVQTARDMGLRVFKLKNAEAQDLAKRLDEFFKNAASGGSTGGGGGGKGPGQMIIHFPYTNLVTGQTEQRVLLHEDVTITPDPSTNSLMVLAPRDSITMMESLIQMLDSVELRTADIQVFQLRNADSEDMVKMLQELFKSSGARTGGGGGGAGQERTQLQLAAEGAAGGAAGGGQGGGVAEITFSSDRRTNSVIAAGSPSNLAVVARLIYQLDVKDQEERIFRVVHLKYAPAKDVATAIKAYFEAESQIFEKGQAGTESAARKIERNVTVQEAGDIQNTLLLSYSRRMEPSVINVVDELDLPPAQVMIQVLMAEVTLDDRLEMGMEFALQDLNFSTHSFTRNGVLQGSGFDKVFGVDLGAQGQSGLGGISFTITGEDFNFLVRALQTEGRLDVLSRPAILVQDSQDATINVGQKVPTVQNVTISGNGLVTPEVSYEEVGIKLDVTPIINPDGFVNLKIKPEVSAIGTSSVTVATGVTLPTFTTRNADTSVTVKDGETVIIGGLITNSENRSENKVPLAGDIPLLGVLFRATVNTQTKTELLMVLTPHVYRDAEQAHRGSIQMRDETNMIDKIRRNPLMGGLQVTPENEFGPSGPPETPVRPLVPPAEEFGPLPEDYGPPLTSIRKGETGSDAAAFRLRPAIRPGETIQPAVQPTIAPVAK